MKLFGSLTGGKGDTEKSSLPWIRLNDRSELEELKTISYEVPVLLYKHSTRCGISAMIQHRLEREYDLTEEELRCYYIDLIRFRELSSAIAQTFNVVHESPQVILVINGKVVYHNSHNGISFSAIKRKLG